MAPTRFLQSALARCGIILLSLILITTSDTTTTITTNHPGVNIKIRIEALCIDSKYLITEQLIDAYNLLGNTIIQSITLIPFGKSKYYPNNHTITCQHGNAECDANSWEQCLLHQLCHPTQTAIFLPIMDCLYRNLTMGKRTELFPLSFFENCINQPTLFEKVKDCHDDVKTSRYLQRQAQNRTGVIEFVPSIEIDGLDVPFDDLDHHLALTEWICRVYLQSGGVSSKCRYYDHDGVVFGLEEGRGNVVAY